MWSSAAIIRLLVEKFFVSLLPFPSLWTPGIAPHRTAPSQLVYLCVCVEISLERSVIEISFHNWNDDRVSRSQLSPLFSSRRDRVIAIHHFLFTASSSRVASWRRDENKDKKKTKKIVYKRSSRSWLLFRFLLYFSFTRPFSIVTHSAVRWCFFFFAYSLSQLRVGHGMIFASLKPQFSALFFSPFSLFRNFELTVIFSMPPPPLSLYRILSGLISFPFFLFLFFRRSLALESPLMT